MKCLRGPLPERFLEESKGRADELVEPPSLRKLGYQVTVAFNDLDEQSVEVL